MYVCMYVRGVCMRNLTPSVGVQCTVPLPSVCRSTRDAATLDAVSSLCSSSLLVAFVFGFVPANPMPVWTLKQQQHFSSSSSSNNKNQQHNHKYRAIRKAHKTKRYQRIWIEHATWQQRIEFKSDCSYRLVVVEPSTQTVRILACSVGKRSTLTRTTIKTNYI